MKNELNITLTGAALVLLAACGGGGGNTADGPMLQTTPPPQTAAETPTTSTDPDPVVTPGNPVTPPPPTDPVPVVDSSDLNLLTTLAAIAAGETAISAAALVTDTNTGDRSVLTRDGLYARADGSLNLSSLAATLNTDVAGDFDNAASFSQSDAVGIVGLATPIDDLRVSGDAQFVGGASGFVIEGADGVDLINGTSTVDVFFTTGSVNVTLDGFDAVSQVTGQTVDSSITDMTLVNATISGTGFSGGAFTTNDADGAVDLTGTNTVTVSQGQFFGLEPDGETPDEVGGVILSEGDSAIIYGTFIAD